jgi:Fe-S-cluster-containing dehydrogenase component
MKTILVDPAKCLQCCNCQIACKDEHVGNDWSPIAAPQAEHQFWIHVQDKEVSTGARVKVERVAQLCQHCAKPSCLKACPNNAIYKRDDGIVIIDPEKCKGCGACKAACQYGVIYTNDELNISQKCTMCAHLLDNGWNRPRCVAGCPGDALSFVDTADLTPENMYAPLERLHPEYGTEPQVAYVNLPKPFIGGEVYNAAGEILEDARVCAKHQVLGNEYVTYTNCFGDFDVTGLHPGFYTITIEMPGYQRKSISNIDARTAQNVDRIILWPKV